MTFGSFSNGAELPTQGFDYRKFLLIFLYDKIDNLACQFYNQTREEITYEILSNLQRFDRKLKEIAALYPTDSIYILEYGGIGDSLHTKLFCQHMSKEFNDRPITLLTNRHTKSLYRDDPSLECVDIEINNRYRNPAFDFVTNGLSDLMSTLFTYHLKKQNNITCDISKAISRVHFRSQMGFKFDSLADPYYIGTGIVRDYDMKHEIVHNGTIPDIGPFVCLETGSISFKEDQPMLAFYNELVKRILEKNLKVVLLGGPDDICPEGVIDMRGCDYYDAFSYVKNCHTFIGRNSANQGLTLFCHDVPVIDVNSSDEPTLIFTSTKYRENVAFVKTDKDSPEDVANLLRTS